MAENKSTTKTANQTKNENKDFKKILVVIVIVAFTAAILLFLSANKTHDTGDLNNNTNVSNESQSDEEMLLSKTWVWVNTQMNDGSEVIPSTDGVFTADFLAENRFSAGTDCNTGNTTYELGQDNALIINGPMATTLMFCEGSNESEYFQDLQNVQSYMFDEEGNLVLLLKFDSGSMIFE